MFLKVVSVKWEYLFCHFDSCFERRDFHGFAVKLAYFWQSGES
jgi:hypothetical protein